MKRVEINEPFSTLLAQARKVVGEVKAQAVVLLADLPYDFAAIRNELHPTRLVVATDKVELFRTVLDDDVDLVPLIQEPESRRLQLSQALLEAIADELLQSGDTVVALYPGFELHDIDTLSIISLGEHLARLTSRDLQRLGATLYRGELSDPQLVRQAVSDAEQSVAEAQAAGGRSNPKTDAKS